MSSFLERLEIYVHCLGWTFFLTLILSARPAQGQQVDRVVLVSVDGLSSDLIRLTDPDLLPGFRRLMDEGAYTLNARTDPDYSITLPNHVSMMTGRFVAGGQGHGWTSNLDPPPGATIHDGGGYVASAFDVVNDNGGSTAVYATKTKFSLFDASYTLGRYVFRTTSAALLDESAAAAPHHLALIHMAEPDNGGHAQGWEADDLTAYGFAVRLTDHLITDLMDVIESHPEYAGRTALLVTTDHGGTGRNHHDPTDPANYTIPFFAWGPGVDQGQDLYALNASRADPGPFHVTRSEAAVSPPIFNAEAGNLALSLLGYPPIPDSQHNVLYDLALSGAGAPPSTPPPASTTLTLQDGLSGYVGTRDTKLRSDRASINFGSDTQLEADGQPPYRVLLGWDVSTVPRGAQIISASVSFTVTDPSNSTYALYALETPWSEQEATWNRPSAAAAWASEGAGSADRRSGALAAFVPSSTGLRTIQMGSTGLAEIQRWIDDPGSNQGFVLDVAGSGTDGVDLASRESSRQSARPSLALTYTDSGDAPAHRAPVATFTWSPAEPALGTEVRFDASGSYDPDGTISQYAWDFGDGASALGEGVGHQFTSAGTWTVTLTVTDDHGLASSETGIVTVLDAAASRLSLQQGVGGYSGARDTKIKSDSPDTPFAAAEDLEVDGQPDYAALLYWDLSAVPADVGLIDATLRLSVFNVSPDTYRLYSLSASWDDQATWRQRTATETWAAAGARGDRSTEVLGTLTAARTGTAEIELNAAGLAVVQAWIRDPSSNHGFMISNYDDASDGIDFWSGDAVDTLVRPELEITYSAGVNAGRSSGTSTGIQTVPLPGSAGLVAYPNPFDDRLQIELAGGGNARLELLDILGRSHGFVQLQDGRAEVSTSRLQPGTYLLRTETREQAVMVSKAR